MTNHSGSFTDKFLDEFGTGHADERALGVVGDCTGQQSLSRSGGTVEEDSLNEIANSLTGKQKIQ